MVIIIVLVNKYPTTSTYVFQDRKLTMKTLSNLPIVQNIGKEVTGRFIQLANANVICAVEIFFGIAFLSFLFMFKQTIVCLEKH